MGTCANCGNRKFRLMTYGCEVDERTICDHCAVFVGVVYPSDFTGPEWVPWMVCGMPCAQALAALIAPHVAPPSLWTATGSHLAHDQFRFARPFYYARPETYGASESVPISLLGVSARFLQIINGTVGELIANGQLAEYNADMKTADEKVRAARYEEGALIYEKWHLLDEAGRARRGAQTQYVRQVSVDLNRILDQIRKDGLSIPYKCTSCGSSLRIDASTQTSALSTCGHCGSTYDRGQLTEFLSKILG